MSLDLKPVCYNDTIGINWFCTPAEREKLEKAKRRPGGNRIGIKEKETQSSSNPT